MVDVKELFGKNSRRLFVQALGEQSYEQCVGWTVIPGGDMSQQPKEQEFAIQNRVYTLHALQGQIRELEGKAPERRIHIDSGDRELELDIPWQAEVDQDHVIDLVYAVNKDQPEEKKPYYIYDRDTGQIELDDTHPKPNKNMILAVVDFVLVIILGLGAVKLIFPLIRDDFLWGMGIALAILICIYVLVNLATYSFFFRHDLAQRKAMNQKIKELAQAFHAPSQAQDVTHCENR